jgi:hypothetical protein
MSRPGIEPGPLHTCEPATIFIFLKLQAASFSCLKTHTQIGYERDDNNQKEIVKHLP